MGEISRTEEEWNSRAADLNYCCRACRQLITFADQQRYFAQGLCQPCLNALNEERNNPNSKARKRLEEIRGRGGPAALPGETPQS